MRTRILVPSVLILAAGLALIAAPRLIPLAIATPSATIEPELTVSTLPPDLSVSVLDDRDALSPVKPDVESVPVVATVAKPPLRPAAPQRDVDLVIALDTSGSMEGLLDSARARLWDIVDEVSEKEPNARLRVGLVTFGSPGVAGPEQGYVAIRSDLTTDLDALYGQVMALRTDGGEEFVGWTLHRSLTGLNWSSQPGAGRILFIAGNESADQARNQHDFRTVALAAKERGVVINSLFAGNAEQGVREGWSEVARAGGGFYTAIDQASGTRQISAPQDQQLLELNARLNNTYLGYGRRGAEGKANQLAQDGNAQTMGVGSASTRVSAKSKSTYDNSAWDLLDAVKRGKLDVAEAPSAALPPEMQAMDEEEREVFVDELSKEREAIQAEIDRVSDERKQFIKRKRAEQGDEADGLDDAMKDALEEQL